MKAAVTPLHPSMGPAVLAHLSRFAALETLKARHPGAVEIFVAGQAVASALSELYADGRCVAYNDVDAFVMDDGATRSRQILATLEFEQARLSIEYGHLSAELVSVYDVRQTCRTEMLNEVVCRPGVDFVRYPVRAARAFLESFDLNCVQVGVRLSDGALVWTAAFEEFLRTRQMLVTSVKTPVHTAIRWFKKKAELAGVYGHDEHAMELLAAMARRVASRTNSASLRYRRILQAQAQFGPQYAAKAQAVGAQLVPYFELRPVQREPHGKAVSLFTLVPRSGGDARLLNPRIEDPLLPVYARALQGHWRRPVCERVLDLLSRPNQHLGRLNLSVHGMETIASVRSNAHLDRMDAVCSRHPGLSAALRALDVGQQQAFLLALAGLAREEGLWAYGIFEQLPQASCEDLERASVQAMPQAVRRVFEQRCARMEHLTREGANRAGALGSLAAARYGGFRFRLLDTFQALAEEGERMHHCVAGYFASVAGGDTRIVALRKPRVDASLTMELRRTGRRWRMQQLRGLVNRPATQDETQIALRYVVAMNLQERLSPWGRRLSARALLGAAGPVARFLPKSVSSLGPSRYSRGLTRRKRVGRWPRTKVTLLLVGREVNAYLVRERQGWASPLCARWPAFCQAMAKSAWLRLASATGLLSKERAASRLAQHLLDARSREGLEADLPF